MRVHDYLGGRGLTFNCSIARGVAPQHAAKLVEIVIYMYDRSIVQCGCIRSICHDKVQISCSFRLYLVGAQCTYKHGSVARLIVPTLVLFPPSNCTCISVYHEINVERIQGNMVYTKAPIKEKFPLCVTLAVFGLTI